MSSLVTVTIAVCAPPPEGREDKSMGGRHLLLSLSTPWVWEVVWSWSNGPRPRKDPWKDLDR